MRSGSGLESAEHLQLGLRGTHRQHRPVDEQPLHLDTVGVPAAQSEAGRWAAQMPEELGHRRRGAHVRQRGARKASKGRIWMLPVSCLREKLPCQSLFAFGSGDEDCVSERGRELVALARPLGTVSLVARNAENTTFRVGGLATSAPCNSSGPMNWWRHSEHANQRTPRTPTGQRRRRAPTGAERSPCHARRLRVGTSWPPAPSCARASPSAPSWSLRTVRRVSPPGVAGRESGGRVDRPLAVPSSIGSRRIADGDASPVVRGTAGRAHPSGRAST